MQCGLTGYICLSSAVLVVSEPSDVTTPAILSTGRLRLTGGRVPLYTVWLTRCQAVLLTGFGPKVVFVRE